MPSSPSSARAAARPPERVTLYPQPASPLFHANHPVRIANDKPWGGQARIDSHRADSPQLAWLNRCKGKGPFTLVDVGANVGLFSRQALIALPNDIACVHAYEPDGESCRDAEFNLAPWRDKVKLWNCALGDQDREFELYRDMENSGNYSSFLSAMAKAQHDSVTASMVKVEREAAKWVELGRPIVYKSDTQGYDEALASLIDIKMWRENVFAAIFELWRIDKPRAEGFRAVLESFDHRRLMNVPEEAGPRGADLSIDAIYKWLNRPFDYGGDDLAVWRDATPAISGGKVAIIIGGAECVWKDVEMARELCAAAGAEATFFACNDMIAQFPDPAVGVTLHPEKIAAWLGVRRAKGYPALKQMWCNREHRSGLVTNNTRDWGGSVGLFAAGPIAVKYMGFKKVLLCGVPMTVMDKHFERHQPWHACTSFQRSWEPHLQEIKPFVRSFGGWTAEKLGTPEATFLSDCAIKAA